MNEPFYISSVFPGDIVSSFTDPKTVVKIVEGDINAYVQRLDDSWAAMTFFGKGRVYIARENGTYGSWTNIDGIPSSATVAVYPKIGWPWPISATQSVSTQNALIAALANERVKSGMQTITVSWKTPCFQSIGNSFNVMVMGKRGNGGR